MSACIGKAGEFGEHTYTLGNFVCDDCGFEDNDAMFLEVEKLRRWKAEALPVMDGLQELGGALGLPLGSRITGRESVDAALDLRNKVRRVEALALHLDTLAPGDRHYAARIRAALNGNAL